MEKEILEFIEDSIKSEIVTVFQLINKFKVSPDICQKLLKTSQNDKTFAIYFNCSLQEDRYNFKLSTKCDTNSETIILALSNNEIDFNNIFKEIQSSNYSPIKCSACTKRIRKSFEPVMEESQITIESVQSIKKEKNKKTGVMDMFAHKTQSKSTEIEKKTQTNDNKSKNENIKKELKSETDVEYKIVSKEGPLKDVKEKSQTEIQEKPQKDVKEKSKSEIQEKSQLEVKEKSKNETKSKKAVDSKKTKSKITETKAKSKKESPSKTDKLFENYADEEEVISRGSKRKRLVIDSDDEDEIPDKVLVESSFTEEPIPEKCSTSISEPACKKLRRKVMRKVDRTYKDEDGFLVTEKVTEFVEDSGDEDVEEESSIDKNNNKTEQKKTEEKQQSSRAPVKKNGSKKLPVSDKSGKVKQTSLTTFFQKV